MDFDVERIAASAKWVTDNGWVVRFSRMSGGEHFFINLDSPSYDPAKEDADVADKI